MNISFFYNLWLCWVFCNFSNNLLVWKYNIGLSLFHDIFIYLYLKFISRSLLLLILRHNSDPLETLHIAVAYFVTWYCGLIQHRLLMEFKHISSLFYLVSSSYCQHMKTFTCYIIYLLIFVWFIIYALKWWILGSLDFVCLLYTSRCV